MMRGELSQRVIAEISRDPNRTSVQIAEALGVRPAYVRTVARRNGIKYGVPRKARKRISRENVLWVHEAAQDAGCTFYEMLNAIVTDARLDAEEAA